MKQPRTSILECANRAKGCRRLLRYLTDDVANLWATAKENGWWRNSWNGEWTCSDCRAKLLPIPQDAIVVVSSSQSGVYVQVLENSKYPKDLEIDLQQGTWTFHTYVRLIGYGNGERGGFLGVYDRRDTSQLQAMLIDAVGATRNDVCVSD